MKNEEPEIFAAIIHEPGEEEDESKFSYIYPNTGDEDDIKTWMEMLDRLQNLMIKSDVDEVQNFSIEDTFPIVLVKVTDSGDLNMVVNFDVWTKSLKKAVIGEIPNQIRLLDEYLEGL